MIRQPCAASALAAASPMPALAPVMTATRCRGFVAGLVAIGASAAVGRRFRCRVEWVTLNETTKSPLFNGKRRSTVKAQFHCKGLLAVGSFQYVPVVLRVTGRYMRELHRPSPRTRPG